MTIKTILLILTCSCLAVSSYSQTFFRSELPTELDRPWEIVYGPDDFLWLSESQGRVSRVDPITGAKTVVYEAPDFFGGSPLENSPLCTEFVIGAGTYGLALHPDFAEPATACIYLFYSYNYGNDDTPSTKFKIVRLKWDEVNETVSQSTDLIEGIETGYDHLGGRLMAIKQNGEPYLFLTIGDHGLSEDNAPDCYSPQSNNPNNFTQDPSTQNGKIHRFNIDGTIPADNPIANNSFYTRGHRNPQGLMYHPELEMIYAVEHGDRTDDEINILYKGMNYGWKSVRGYKDDESYPGEAQFADDYIPNPEIDNDSLVDPFYSWCTTPATSSIWTDWCTVAPSGGEYYGGEAIPQWTNSLLVVTLKDGATSDKEVYQFKLTEDGQFESATGDNPNPSRFFGADQNENGRLRDIAVSRDGKSIYLINNGGTDRDKITVYTYDPWQGLDVLLYPNPAQNWVSIGGLEGTFDNLKVMVYDPVGQVVDAQLEPQRRVNISHLASGLHFLHLDVDGVVHVLKFIKS